MTTELQGQERSNSQFDGVIKSTMELAMKKHRDYGSVWTILRGRSITDQIFIKAKRIRSIQEAGENKVNDSIEDEFKGILNYAAMATIIVDEKNQNKLDMSIEEFRQLMEGVIQEARDLFQKKNHDYGEAWREIYVS